MEYSIVYSRRKTLAIEITPQAELLVRAPKSCRKVDIERFIASHEAWIEAHIEKQKKRLEAMPEPTEQEKAELIRMAKEYLPSRVEYFGDIMGLKPTSLKITGAKTRFGSCSGKNGICFSWRLMRYPQDAIDYVVVHELAHIVHKNHGPDFYALIVSVLPDYKSRQKLLRG